MGTKGWIQFEISTELEVLLYISVRIHMNVEEISGTDQTLHHKNSV